MPIPPRLRALAGGCLLLAACTDPAEPVDAPPPLERGVPRRFWMFGTYPGDGTALTIDKTHSQKGGEVRDSSEVRPAFVSVAGDSTTIGEVFGSADGVTYSVSSRGYPSSFVEFQQLQSFRKRAADASLTLTVTAVRLDGGDFNSDPVPTDCVASGANCLQLQSEIAFEVKAWRDTVLGKEGRLFFGQSGAVLRHDRNRWRFAASLPFDPEARPMWSSEPFAPDFDPGGGFTGLTAKVALARPIRVPIDLSAVGVGEEFTVRVRARAIAYNLTGRESLNAAYFRDPADVRGMTVEAVGLEPGGDPAPEPSFRGFGAAPACAGGGGGGTLQFSRADYRAEELPVGEPEHLTVTRTGGSSGRVSATVSTSNGSAVEGADYTAVVGTVAFEDGDTAPRSFTVPLALDTIAEPDETVRLTLSDPRGCATLGASTAELTIVDNDRPPPPSSFTVGGAVTGLAGSGLVLRNATGGDTLAVGGNGPYAFRLLVPTGIAYDIQVATQPTNPAQLCTVANGRDTMGNAAVSDVAVTCVTPAGGAPDPTFGGDGVVQTRLAGAAGGAVAVQGDGKVVVAGSAKPGGDADFALTRYNPDGSLDATFGSGGTVTTGFSAGSSDDGLDVAVQADGKIVVAGQSRAAGERFFDLAVARYNADGSLDATFGGDGTVTTDVGASGPASARGVVVQPDGRIVVAGDAEVGRGRDFVLARYNTDGTPDATFGTRGIATADFTTLDAGHDVALTADGRIVVAGLAATGTERDFAVARFNPDGSVDRGFGTNGHATVDVGGADEAFGVVVEPDGKIVAAGTVDAPPGAAGVDFALARFSADGRIDTGFGSGGTVRTNFTAGRDRGAELARQADGKLVVVGLTTSASLATNDFALARYLPDGRPDAAFGLDGRLTVDVSGSNDEAAGVAVQADGKIVAAGTASGGIAVVRVRP